MARGGSPPPKLHEENLFTEGSSRKRAKFVFRLKGESDCWDKIVEEKYSGNSVEEYTNSRFGSAQKKQSVDSERLLAQNIERKGR